MTINDDEVLCDKCNGLGYLLNEFRISKNNNKFHKVCPKCLGDGSFDWIENIVGKKDFRPGSPLDMEKMYISANAAPSIKHLETLNLVGLGLITEEKLNGIK